MSANNWTILAAVLGSGSLIGAALGWLLIEGRKLREEIKTFTEEVKNWRASDDLWHQEMRGQWDQQRKGKS